MLSSLRSIGLRAASRRCGLRALSTGGLARLEHSELPSGHKIATLKLSRAPVNSLNLDLIRDASACLAEAEASDAVGLVLASDMGTIFSAGLDITEMHPLDKARLNEFWEALQDLWLALYGSKLATVAAIDGHAPAGGCLLAACCDVRVMAEGKFKIGLNETQLGIVAPPWFYDSVSPLLGVRATDRMLQLGEMLSPDQALAKGLVDRLEEHGEVEAAALEELQAYVKIDPEARHASKMLSRGPALERLRATKEQDRKDFVAFLSSDKVQATLGGYMAMLSKKSKGKK